MREALSNLKNYADDTLKNQLSSALGHHAGLPLQLTEFSAELTKLQSALQTSPASVLDDLAPILAAVAAYGRRRFVGDLEDRRVRALTGELLGKLDTAKAPLDDLLKATWYLAATPLRLPRLRDFVAASRFDTKPPLPSQRHLDDKFAVLWSASDLPNDLRLTREECDERFTPLAIAFIDVDGLKALNSQMGETWVDALILPPLMRSVERAAFGHGHAYRYGGDEFVILMPSTNREVAFAILRGLRDDLANSTLESVDKPPTVSIGVCVLHPESPLTDREALHWAALAKREAKTVHNAIAFVAANREIDNPRIEVLTP